MNRGARHELIFLTEEDRLYFLALLAQLPVRFAVLVHAYALMGNHFHLLLTSLRSTLSRAMQYLESRYVRHLNDTHPDWDGPVFRGRFRNRVVEDDRYWQELFLYVPLNPVRARMPARLHDPLWTSHSAYARPALAPSWISTQAAIDAFGSRETYVAELRTHADDPGWCPETWEPERLWLPDSTENLPPGEVAASVTQEVALQAATAVLMAEPARNSQELRAAAVFVSWCLCVGAGLTHAAAAQLLGVDRSTVSKRLSVGEHLLSKPRFARWCSAWHERTGRAKAA